KSLATDTADPSVPWTGEHFKIGGPHVLGNQVQVIFQASAKNPVSPAPSAITPAIDYSMDVTYNKTSGKLTFRGSVDSFPAFEAYASRNNGKPEPLFKLMPAKKDTIWLYEFGLGVNTQSIMGSISLILLDGVWESTDPAKRFRLEISKGNRCRFIERSQPSSELAREMLLLTSGSEESITYKIERPNTDEQVLIFLGYSPSIRQTILTRSPQPSFLQFRQNGAQLDAEWHGIQVIKDERSIYRAL